MHTPVEAHAVILCSPQFAGSPAATAFRDLSAELRPVGRGELESALNSRRSGRSASSRMGAVRSQKRKAEKS